MHRKILHPIVALAIAAAIPLPIAGEPAAQSREQALSALCKKLMYKNCTPERDRQLKQYFGDTDISALERSMGNYPGAAPAFEALPKDRNGMVDWGAAVTTGIIQPRDSISGNREPEQERYHENILVMRTRIDVIPDVIFPHGAHTYWINCDSCHPRPFSKRKGGTRFSMRDIIDGEYCGKCHGKVAFAANSFKNCSRCHALQKTTDIPPWGDL